MLNQMGRTQARRKMRQLEFRFRPWGGARKGAGRKARAEREGFLPHGAREVHEETHPVHVTARAVRGAPNLRSQRVWAVLRGLFARASEKGFRLLHFSVQGNHVHLIVEADDGVALARGVQRLLSRIAMTVNALARRAGSVWRDRHHRQVLKGPRQVRNALVYVLFNSRRHEMPGQKGWDVAMETIDPCSSAFWFDSWSPACRPPPIPIAQAGPSLVVPPRTWLADEGWRRRGLIRFDEVPRPW
jgi:REP element-mobilizing transposase RayT